VIWWAVLRGAVGWDVLSGVVWWAVLRGAVGWDVLSGVVWWAVLSDAAGWAGILLALFFVLFSIRKFCV